MTAHQARAALLRVEDLGFPDGTIERAEYTWGEASPPGCLAALDLETALDAPVVESVHYTDTFAIALLSTTASFPNATEASQALDSLRDAAARCTGVEELPYSTFEYSLTIDNTPAPAGVDEFLAVTAMGAADDGDGSDSPLVIATRVARIGSAATGVSLFELGGGQRIDTLAQVAVDRLQAELTGDGEVPKR
jgi:hypothetical protein